MNATERRDLTRRIDRTRRLAYQAMKVADQLSEQLAHIEAIVRDSEQPEMPVKSARPASRKAMTEDDVLDLIRRVFGTGGISIK